MRIASKQVIAVIAFFVLAFTLGWWLSPAIARGLEVSESIRDCREQYEHMKGDEHLLNSEKLLPLLTDFASAQNKAWIVTGRFLEMNELAYYGFTSGKRQAILKEVAQISEHDDLRKQSYLASLLPDSSPVRNEMELAVSDDGQSYILWARQYYSPYFVWIPIPVYGFDPMFEVRCDSVILLSPGLWNAIAEDAATAPKFIDKTSALLLERARDLVLMREFISEEASKLARLRDAKGALSEEAMSEHGKWLKDWFKRHPDLLFNPFKAGILWVPPEPGAGK